MFLMFPKTCDGCHFDVWRPVFQRRFAKVNRSSGIKLMQKAQSSRIAFLAFDVQFLLQQRREDRKSTRLNSSHSQISYAVFCLKKKKKNIKKIKKKITKKKMKIRLLMNQKK